MSKAKKIILPLIFILITLLLMYVAFTELNIFPGMDLGEIIGVNGTGSIDNVRENEQIIEELKAEHSKKHAKNKLPDDMNALWIDINKDITASAEQGTEAVKYSIYSDIDYYRNFIPDVFFIKPDTEKEYSALKEPDGTDYDILAYLLYYVRSIDCEAVLVADDDILLDESGKPHTKELEKYLSGYSFNSVLISVDASYSDPLYAECAQVVASFINERFSSINVGIEIHSDFEKQFADDFTASVFHNGLVDFGYVDCLCTSANIDFPFQSVALWWNYFAEYYDIPLYCEMRLDKIFSEEGDWSFSTEINNQLKALYFCPAFDGSCFYNASVLRNKKSLARDLAIFMNDVAGTNSDAYELDSLSVNGSLVKFTGKAVDNTGVFCNDTNIPVAENRFEYTSYLLPGMNEFKFFANGAYYVHSIYNNSSLFLEYSSEDDVKLDSEMMVNVKAVCPSGASVFAVVNGEYYALSRGESSDGVNSVFTCGISFYGKEIYSDKLDVICFYGEQTETVACGSIKRHFNKTEEKPLSTVTAELTPYSDNGLGTALMCVTKYDNTEIISSVSDYDTYHPYNSSLPEGVIDYIKNINVSDEGYIRYELESGLNVYGVDAVLINNGYSLPLNNVLLKNCDNSLGDVNLTFSVDWCSPVTVTVDDVAFSKGYEQFSFNVEQFDAEYIDVNFYHTAGFSSYTQFSLAENPLFSSYELLALKENAITLRLYLRNAGAFYGYDIKYNNNELTVSFNYLDKSTLSGKVIMIDAGHGGISMVGTALNDNSVSESQITLGIAGYVKQCLEGMGAKVIMTRTMDTSLSLSERTYMCETQNPDIFVSIHCDGADDLSESGTHTFYYTPYSYELAKSIHNRIVTAYTNSIYSPSDDNFEQVDRKVKYYPFYVTRVDNCPSVLVETGFLTNYVEGNVLANPQNQNIIGNAVAYGIMDFFS